MVAVEVMTQTPMLAGAVIIDIVNIRVPKFQVSQVGCEIDDPFFVKANVQINWQLHKAAWTTVNAAVLKDDQFSVNVAFDA